MCFLQKIMDSEDIVWEYLKGREEVKEYPNFGVQNIFTPERRKVKRRLLHVRKKYDTEQFLTQKKQLKHRKVCGTFSMGCIIYHIIYGFYNI